MGQAKKRGTREDRIAEAKRKIEYYKPDLIRCKHCETIITELIHLPTDGMTGIKAAFGGVCPSCSKISYALVSADPATQDAH